MRRKRVSCILGGVSVALVFAGCVEGLDGGVTLWNFISLCGAKFFLFLCSVSRKTIFL